LGLNDYFPFFLPHSQSFQKIFYPDLADEADAGGIGLGGDGNFRKFGDRPDFGFAKIGQGKKDAAKSIFGDLP
jgi:hypothetical protein